MSTSGKKNGSRYWRTMGLALAFGTLLCQPSLAGDREDAAAFVAATMKCPVPNERQTDSWGLFHLIKTHNEYTGNARTFRLREHYTDTMGKTGGEMYTIPSHNDVSFSFSDIDSVSLAGTKATIRCRSEQKCIHIFYVINEKGFDPDSPADCWEEGICRSQTKREKTSYRVSTCSAQAAHDVKDAVEFLAGVGGSK